MVGEQSRDVPVEYTDSAERPAVSLTDEAARLTAAHEGPHGGAAQWLAHNLEDPERGPVVHAHETATEGSGPRPGYHRADDGNLLQLPDGATFGTQERPSPEEREELLRYAAEAQGEMQGKATIATAESTEATEGHPSD